jgi:upstream activation factor subunit UAF30
MPRQSKSKTDVPETTPTVTVTTAVEQTAAPVAKAKRETKPKAAKTETVATPTVETATATATATVTSTVVDVTETEVSDLSVQSAEFLVKLNQLGSLIASLKTEYRSLEKKWSREIKTAQKTNAKRKRKTGNRQPSGFVKPTKISDELAKFLEKPTGTEMARTDVTREINKYIRSHNLQDKENGRKINPDTKLQTLLKLKKTDELTYFNLQRYMSPHFSKAEKAAVAAVIA